MFTVGQFEGFEEAGVGQTIIKLGGANNTVYADYSAGAGSARWSEHVKAARAAGQIVGHYWFNGRDGSWDQQAAKIVGTYNGVKIEPNERLWWDVETEGTKPHWTPAEVVAAATALDKAGIPFSRQGIYLSSSVTRNANWKPVVDLGLPLWVADYGINNGQISSKPLVGYWPEAELWQYTSVGKLPGYDGNLDLNITGKDVWTVHKLQDALNDLLGLSLVVDGDYGPATKAAVSEFQKRNGLVVDGDAGTKTLTALEKILAEQ